MARRMPSVDDVRRLFDYNWAVFDAYLARAERLPWRAATANRGSGHLSIKNTLVHILNVHEAWFGYVLPRRIADMRRATGRRTDELRSWRAVRAYRDRVKATLDDVLAGLTDRQLRAPIKAPWMPGRYTVGDAAMQTTLEQAHHLGEIIALFWQKDIEPPEMTWIDTHRRLALRSARRRR
jgi:uncharacterized damage-inducible protein DinB